MTDNNNYSSGSICHDCEYGKYVPSPIMKVCVFCCSYGGGCFMRPKNGKSDRKDKRRDTK